MLLCVGHRFKQSFLVQLQLSHVLKSRMMTGVFQEWLLLTTAYPAIQGEKGLSKSARDTAREEWVRGRGVCVAIARRPGIGTKQ